MDYDLIIIGAGPAGLTAAVYAARYKLNVLIISRDSGGLAATAHKICNYPSYPEVSGFDLMQKFVKQVEELKVPVIYEDVHKIEKVKEKFIVSTVNKKYKSKKIIFAIGTTRSKLNVPGEKNLLGRGVSYCATCDAAFFKNKITAVVGGSDAALTASLLLNEYASKVYIVYRKGAFIRGEPAWIELVDKEKKIEKLFNEEILEIIGNDKVEGVKLKSGKTLNIDGIFIEIGSVPEVSLAHDLGVKLNEKNYVITDKEQKTSVLGFFAAGDITNNCLKQIVTAASEGAVAAYQAYSEIKKDEMK